MSTPAKRAILIGLPQNNGTVYVLEHDYYVEMFQKINAYEATLLRIAGSEPGIHNCGDFLNDQECSCTVCETHINLAREVMKL